MTVWSVLPAFAGVMMLAAIAPGPDFVVVVQRAAVSGRRAGMLAAAGVGAGVAVWAVAAATGIAALLAASATAYTVVKLAGAVYLVFLGVRALVSAVRRRGALGGAAGAVTPASARRSFLQGLLCNVLNPKAAVFFVALFPQFLPSHASVADVAALTGVAVAVVFTWFCAVANLVGALRRLFTRDSVRRTLDSVTGVVMLALGARLAAAQQ